MKVSRSFKQSLAQSLRHWKNGQYTAALGVVETMMRQWPGNARLHVLWASLVQLQDEPGPSLAEAKRALRRAVELDADEPTSAIELGHFLDNIEDNPQAAAKAFLHGTGAARRLLIDGLLGQTKALLQIDRRDEAMRSLMEALYLANTDSLSNGSEAAQKGADIVVRDQNGWLSSIQVKGPFAAKIDDLLRELFPRRSA